MSKEIIVASIPALAAIINNLFQFGDETTRSVVTAICGVAFLVMIGVLISKSVKLGLECPPYERHSVFSDITNWSSWVESKFRLGESEGDKGRESLFKNILLHSLYFYNIKLKEFIKKAENYMTPSDVSTAAHRLINDYKMEMQLYFHKNDMGLPRAPYTDEDKKTLEIVVRKFLSWQDPKLEAVIRAVATITSVDSKFYGEPRQQVSIILAHFGVCIADTFRHAEATLQHLNGDLAGHSFRGKALHSTEVSAQFKRHNLNQSSK